MAVDQLCFICRAPISPGQRKSPFDWSISRRVIEWSRYCKVVYKSANGSYMLSGISYRHNRGTKDMTTFNVPVDRHAIAFRAKDPAGKRLAFSCMCTPADYCRLDHGRHCYHVHAYCWDWLEQLLGPVAEEKLDLLVAVVEERWREIPFKKRQAWLRGWVIPYCSLLHRVGDQMVKTKKYAMLSDPSRIQPLRCILSHVKKCTHFSISTRRLQRQYLTYSSSSPLRLPYDIQLPVLDLLEDLADIANIVAAFQWDIPESYWRRRFPWELIYELGQMDSGKLNWICLFKKYQNLLKRSPLGLENRHRIHQNIFQIRDRFWDAVQKDDAEKPVEVS